jgi:glycosyltransferase involved in cell wall biosynthesis
MGVKTVELANLGRERVFGSGALHLVTVARLNPAKGHTHALAAIDSCVKSGLDLTYTIAGEGPHREFILSRINELGLNGRVRVTGALSETEILQLLSAADVFILPSIGLGEAWPVSVMEAMGAALPVIASDIGATPEMIVSGEDGILVPQADEHAISQAITLLARDVGARQRMGYAARQTATRRFDVAVTANVLLRAIQSGSELSCT